MSNVVHKLLRPVKFEDKNYEMIPLDLDSLSGRDIKEAKKEFELANPQKGGCKVFCVQAIIALP